MDIFGFSFTLLEKIVLSILLASFLYQIYFYLRYMNGVLGLRRKIRKNKVPFLNNEPGVSVIICAKNEENNLRKFLPFILQQEYPDFEVIVVNDGSVDETEILLRNLTKQYPNLRTTFVPYEANHLSTKKLGITLGIKAAKNDLLLFTDADCMPEDKFWIARISRNFTDGTDFVLGYGAYFKKKSFLNRIITYDTLFIALQYLGMAKAGKPYMGVGRNMAYRKEVFFRQKGFASNLHLKSGDDDLMVNQAANRKNTRIEIAPDSITWSEPENSFKSWFYQKERHLSVSSFYKPSSKFRLVFEPATRGLFYLSVLMAFVFGNMVAVIITGAVLLTRLIVQLIVINRSAKHLGERKCIFLLPFFDIFLPLVSLYIVTVNRATTKGKNIRWK